MQTYLHMTSKLKVGDEAPDFELLDQEGRLVSSRDYRGRKVLALYFYPKDFTKVCTMEAVAFRQMHEQFQAAGAGSSASRPMMSRRTRSSRWSTS